MKWMLLTACSVLLTACSSGGSETATNTDSVDTLAIEQLKGKQQTEALTEVPLLNQDVLNLNSRAVGKMGFMAIRSLSYVPNDDHLLGLQVQSSNPELTLGIAVVNQQTGQHWLSESRAQQESLVLFAHAGSSYTITLTSNEGDGPAPEQDVSFSIFEANRHDLQLADDELYVELNSTLTLDCDFHSDLAISNQRFVIVSTVDNSIRKTNRTGGYPNLATSRLSYDFKICESYTELPSFERISLGEQLSLSLDSNTGSLDGTTTWSYDHSSYGQCDGSGQVRGKVLL